MCLPVIFASIALLLLLIPLASSFRISIEFIVRESSATYTIKGTVFKYVKVMEVNNTSRKRKHKRRETHKRKKGFGEKLPNLIQTALKNRKGKMLHIEELSLRGTFSIEDAAANAVIYGILLIIWQFLLIYLAANFKLEHQYYNFIPDFQNDRNEMMLHVIFRVVVLKAIWLIITWFIETRRKNFNKSE